MAFTEIQQIQNLIEKSHYCLVIFSSAHDVDSIASSLAITQYLQNAGKQVDIVSPGFITNNNLKFLNGINLIKNNIANSQKFTIKVDLENAKLDNLSYDIKDNTLSIHLNPHNGTITKQNLRTASSAFKYDLIITVNTTELDSLNGLFTSNTDLFYRLPIINIDHNATNEQYGQVNITEVDSTSSCEIIYKILNELDPGLVQNTVATYLLTGIISKTKSFKSGNITPHTLSIASKLMKKGGKRDDIIKHLYYHRSISSLKIWGKALSNLQSDPSKGLVWTTITRSDMTHSGSNREDLNEVVDEMLVNSPEAEVIVLFYEQKDISKVNCVVITNKLNAKQLISKYSPEGDKRKAEITIQGKKLHEVEMELIQNIRTNLI